MAKKPKPQESNEEATAVQRWKSPVYIDGIGVVEGECKPDDLAEFKAACDAVGADYLNYVE